MAALGSNQVDGPQAGLQLEFPAKLLRHRSVAGRHRRLHFRRLRRRLGLSALLLRRRSRRGLLLRPLHLPLQLARPLFV